MAVSELAKVFNFSVYFDNTRYSFSRVSGMEEQLETGTIQEGGRNNTEYKPKRKGKAQNTLLLERAFSVQQTEEMRIQVGQPIQEEVSVYLLDEAGRPYWVYYFIGCTITKVSLENLDATRSDVLLQKVEITFQNMEEEAIKQ